MQKEEQQLEKRLSELSNLAYNRDIITYSDFLNLNELNILHSMPKDRLYTKFMTFGGYRLAERQMAAFVSDAFCCKEDYPIACIKISPLNKKFSDVLNHRDYLGSILNLGIDRCKIGDILVEEDGAFVFCHTSMANFLIEEVCRIKHTPVKAERITEANQLPTPKREEISGTVASPRLDSVIGLAFRTSRSSMISYIESGKVFINGKNIVSNGYTLKEGDIVSVRGKGKFQFHSVTSKTKKNRYHVILYKYC